MAIAPELAISAAGEPLKPVTINGRIFQPHRFPSGMVFWGRFKTFEEANKYPITKPTLDLHQLVERAAQAPETLLPWEKFIETYIAENTKRLSKITLNSNRPAVSPHETVDRLLSGQGLDQVQVGWFVARMGTGIELEDVETAGRRANRELASLDLVSGYGTEGIAIVRATQFNGEKTPYIPFQEQREYDLHELGTKAKPRLWERILMRTMREVNPDPKKTMIKFTGKYDLATFNTQLWLANGYLADRKQMMWVSPRGLERGPLHQLTQAA